MLMENNRDSKSDLGRETAEQRFGRVIRELRKASGWTQQELAERLTANSLPMRQNTVAKLESGGRPTSVAEIGVLAEVFETSPGEIVNATFGSSANPQSAAHRQMIDQFFRGPELLRIKLSSEADYQRSLQAITDAVGPYPELRGSLLDLAEATVTSIPENEWADSFKALFVQDLLKALGEKPSPPK